MNSKVWWIAGFVVIFAVSALVLIKNRHLIAKVNPTNLEASANASPLPPSEKAISGSYPYTNVKKRLFGEGASAYWIYTPESPKPKSAPVILFLHGWMAMDPYFYGGWIDHLVKSGNIVIYPVYQESRDDIPEEALENAIAATKNAIAQLKSSGPVTPQLDKFAILGHSFGGGLSAQIAGRAREVGLPIPKAIMPVAPGWVGNSSIPTDKFGQIDSSVLMLIVEGAQDQLENSRQGKTIYTYANKIPPDRKTYMIMLSRFPRRLVVNHGACLSPLQEYSIEEVVGRQVTRMSSAEINQFLSKGEINALDYNGYWKLFDNLYKSAFNGANSINMAITTAEEETGMLMRRGLGTPNNPRRFVVRP